MAVLDNTIDNLFSNLFGITGGSIWRGYIISRGWFADGDMIGSGGLTEKDDSAQTGYSINEDFTSISMNVHNIDYARHGTFLVRNVPQVPEPSTIILICLGIIGFVTTQRNKFIVKA